MNLSDRPLLRLLALCGLYVAQGVPFGFVTVTLAAYLAEQGLGAQRIGGILALGTLPWSFKWLWGPVIDRFGYPAMGRRRPWILLAQSGMAATIAAMIAVPDLTRDVATLGAMVLLHNVFSSLQDVSVDALAVDLLADHERGRANGFMYGSSYLGALIGGAGLGAVLSLAGLRAALTVQVTLLLAIMLLPLLLRERAGERLLPWTAGRSQLDPETETVRSLRALWVDVAKAFAFRATALGALLALAVKIGAGVLSVVGVVLLVDELGWTKEEYIGVTSAATLLGLAGSMLGGMLADVVGPRRLAAIATVLLGATWIAFVLLEPWWSHKLLVSAFVLSEVMLMAVLSVSLFALFMGISWPVVAATQFTAYMALLNLSQTIGAATAGHVRDLLGVREVFLAAGLLQIGLVLLLAAIDPHETRRALAEQGRAEEGKAAS